MQPLELKLPQSLLDLCDINYIKPFSYYVNRKPWSLNLIRAEEAFLNKRGVYCFWWSGSHEFLLSPTNNLSYNGFKYSTSELRRFDHKMIPLYVGMTSKAAKRENNRLTGRLIDRLIRFPKVFQEYKRGKRFELCKTKTGTCGNFDLFGFPERIRSSVASERNSQDLTLHQAEELLIEHPNLISRFSEEYHDLFYDNYSIAFYPCDDDVKMFYTEALAIGYLRPWLNHS